MPTLLTSALCLPRSAATRFLALRRRARERLGPKFDIRQFHEWLIGSGTMPLGVLEQSVNDEVRKALE